MPTKHLTLTVLALYLSETPGAISVPVAELHLLPNHGAVGDSHSGPTQTTDDGEVVPNMRQFTAVNPRELGIVAEDLGVPFLDPAWLKANLCLGWSDDQPFSHTLEPGTLLLHHNERPVMEVKGLVDPCLGAGKVIAAQFPLRSIDAMLFPKRAYGRRGVHGIVLEEATIRIGDTFTVVLPVAAQQEAPALSVGVVEH